MINSRRKSCLIAVCGGEREVFDGTIDTTTKGACSATEVSNKQTSGGIILQMLSLNRNTGGVLIWS